jgi:beta-glucanase (GH16 family)
VRIRSSLRAGVLLAVLSPLVASAACTTPPDPGPGGGDSHPSGYTLQFADEFEGTQLDRGTWCTRYIYGGGPTAQADPECTRNGDGNLDFLNDEQQRYVDTNRNGERMHVVGGGVLSLRATRTRADGWASYESAMIRSKETFRPSGSTSYYVTARVRMPDVVGTWPAFWLNSDRRPDGSTTWPPEIDVFDGALNGREDTNDMLHQAAIIRGAQTASGNREYTFTAPEFDRQWNNFHAAGNLRARWVETSVEWTSTGVCYFVDGYRTACENYRWVENGGNQAAPAHVLVNLAIGGSWAGRHGIDDTRIPTQFDVDWVRVYRRG